MAKILLSAIALFSIVLNSEAHFSRLPSTVPSDSSTPACADGQAAYEATVFPLVRNKCIACHDSPALGPEQGPEHSVADVAVSYRRMLSYLNISNLASSRLVTKGGNNHCSSYGVECGVTKADITPVVQAWWDQGQKNCVDVAKFASGSVIVPEKLPTRKEGFTTVSLSLAGLGPEYGSSILQVDIQKFSAKETEGVDAYRLHSPRVIILGTLPAVRFKGIRFLLNGKWDSRANGYTSVEKTVNHSLRSPRSFLEVDPPTPPTPVTPFIGFPTFGRVEPLTRAGPSGPALTSASLILLSDQGEGKDVLSVAFDSVEVVLPEFCRESGMFEQTILPLVKSRTCTACHSDGSKDATALAKFFIPENKSAACAEFLQRARLDAPMQSTLMKVPTGVTGDHLPLLSKPEQKAALLNWIKAEAAPR